jgi:hypothetical protein
MPAGCYATTTQFLRVLREACGSERLLPGGLSVPVEQIDQIAKAMVKATPDAIVAGPELQLRATPRTNPDHTANRHD